MRTYPKSDYEHYPRTLPADDFQGQVRRTVNGRPVGPEQIELIIEALLDGLALAPDDVVLDLACGNGAISSHLFPRCAGLLGVDRSEYLISVAKQHFERPPAYTFLHADVGSYVESEPDPSRFTKALCCASFAYFGPAVVEAMLAEVALRFTNVERLYISHIPDRDKVEAFRRGGPGYDDRLDDHTGAIGHWRTHEEMTDLASRFGWSVRFHHMPPRFYQHHYRFDALLVRR